MTAVQHPQKDTQGRHQAHLIFQEKVNNNFVVVLTYKFVENCFFRD